MKDLIPNSFWPKGSTEHCVEQGVEFRHFSDLLIRISLTEEFNLLNEVVSKLVQENKGSELYELARYAFSLSPDLYAQIETVLSKNKNENEGP